jgi:hypothetical protein
MDMDKNYEPAIFDDGDSTTFEWVVLELQAPESFQWPRRLNLKRFFAAVVRVKNPMRAAGELEVRCFKEMIDCMTAALNALSRKLVRAKRRKDLVREIEEKLYDWRNDSVDRICQKSLAKAAEVLPGTNMYMGILSVGATQIDFVAANENSDMKGKVLNRGKGVSFEVAEMLDPLVLRADDADKKSLLKADAVVDVRYGQFCHMDSHTYS